ncbi:MAG: hypothetical protein GY778_04165, partial [bacterium]|nr:hypothetical protein [bacterium]
MTLLLILFLLAGAAFAQTPLPPGGGTPPAGATYVNTFEGRSGTVTGAEGDYDLTELGDVLLTTPADLDCLRYDLASGNWTNRPAAQCGGGGGGAPTDSTYITQTPDAGLSAEQALSALATGILKSTTGTGVITIAVAGDIPDLSSLYLTDASAGACTNQFVRAVGDDTGPTCATVATTDAAAVFLVEADVGNGLQVIANTLSVQPLDATITVAAGGIDVGADQVGPTEIDETANYTLTGQHDFTGAELLGGSPLRLEGTTDDNTYTTVLVTDPTGARSFTLPDADSVAIQPSDCGGGNFVRTVSALGVISCASDQTGGSGLSNYAKAVNAAATLTILGSEHNFGHNNIIEPTCYDNSTPAVPWLVGNWTVHPSTFDVVINWVGNKTGECVINGSGGAGTVTSVAVTAPSILSVGGSPITAAGTIALTLATQADNTVFAGPNGGGPLAPTFRLLVEADISDLAHTTVGADHIDALTEIAQGIKTAANDSDPLAVFTGGNPAGTRCVEITSGGQMQAAGDTCANLGPAGATAIEDLGDAAGAGTVAVAEFPQVWDWNSAATAAAVDGLTLNYTLDASTDATAQRILRLVRPEAANTGTLDVALSIENLDTAAQLSVAIQVRSEAGTIGTALDANDADITNVIQFTTGALSHSDLELLDDGAIDLASEVSGVAPDANVANDITLDNLTQITTRNFSAMQGTVGDTQIAAGAVDGGNLGEIADGSVTTDDLGTDSVSADELNASGVQAELEAVLVLANLQGDLLPARVDDGGVAATFALFSGAGGSAAFRALVEADISDLAHTTVAADHIDAMTELATGIKSRADDVDTK